MKRFEYVQHRRTGDLFAVATDGYTTILGAAGPFQDHQLNPNDLPDYDYHTPLGDMLNHAPKQILTDTDIIVRMRPHQPVPLVLTPADESAIAVAVRVKQAHGTTIAECIEDAYPSLSRRSPVRPSGTPGPRRGTAAALLPGRVPTVHPRGRTAQRGGIPTALPARNRARYRVPSTRTALALAGYRPSRATQPQRRTLRDSGLDAT